MSDDKQYTNADLESAENALIAAGAREQAKALRQYTEGIRNFVQGEFGQSFVDAFDRVVGKHVDPLAEQIGGLRDDNQVLQAEFHTGLSGIQDTVSALIETVDGLEVGQREGQEDRKAIHDELAALKEQIAAYMAGSKRDVVAGHDKRLTRLETKALATINSRLAALEENNRQLSAIRVELSALADRIGDALPTEEDQGISTQLRIDAAERAGDG